MSHNKANHTETRREDWITPQWMFDSLNKVFNFKIDLCASDENSKCTMWITEEDDIFSDKVIGYFDSEAWAGYAWINPPYQTHGGTGKFIKRALELSGTNGLVALIPASPGAKWWKDIVWTGFDSIVFPRRFGFEGSKHHAMFDCAICIKYSHHGILGNDDIFDLKKIGSVVDIRK